MSERCERCGLPAWKSNGGMGGGLMPDAETHCLQRGGMWCRTRREAYLSGLREGVEIAKGCAIEGTAHIGSGEYVGVIDWTEVDRELMERTK